MLAYATLLTSWARFRHCIYLYILPSSPLVQLTANSQTVRRYYNEVSISSKCWHISLPWPVSRDVFVKRHGKYERGIVAINQGIGNTCLCVQNIRTFIVQCHRHGEVKLQMGAIRIVCRVNAIFVICQTRWAVSAFQSSLILKKKIDVFQWENLFSKLDTSN